MDVRLKIINARKVKEKNSMYSVKNAKKIMLSISYVSIS